MSLEPFFSLSARNPNAYTYDAANPTAPHASAYLYSFGGYTSHQSNLNLDDQHVGDQVLIAYDPVADTDQTASHYQQDFYRRSSVLTSFKGVNVSTSNQYLLIFRLATSFGSPIAQFFLGLDFVRAEPLTSSPHDDIAILLDVPGNNQFVYPLVRLATAGSGEYHGFFFKGVDCYLL